MKKFAYGKRCGAAFLAVLCWVGSLYATEGEYCAFCDPEVLHAQTFYEDDLVIALYTHKPIVPGHCLVSPKRHVERFEDLSDEEITRIGQVIKQVHAAVVQEFQTSSYLLVQKNGRQAGLSVPHVHVHHIPRKGSALLFVVDIVMVNIKGPISADHMHQIVAKMRAAIEQKTSDAP